MKTNMAPEHIIIACQGLLDFGAVADGFDNDGTIAEKGLALIADARLKVRANRSMTKRVALRKAFEDSGMVVGNMSNNSFLACLDTLQDQAEKSTVAVGPGDDTAAVVEQAAAVPLPGTPPGGETGE